MGPSRKHFLLHESAEETKFATAAAVTAAILGGAHLVRVHDVREMRAAADVADEILQQNAAQRKPVTRITRRSVYRMLMTRVLLTLLLAFAAFGQTRSRLGEYALVLEDAPVARKVQSRMALRSSEAQAHTRKIRDAQSGVIARARSGEAWR